MGVPRLRVFFPASLHGFEYFVPVKDMPHIPSSSQASACVLRRALCLAHLRPRYAQELPNNHASPPRVTQVHPRAISTDRIVTTHDCARPAPSLRYEISLS
jgi:hypothetical protein